MTSLVEPIGLFDGLFDLMRPLKCQAGWHAQTVQLEEKSEV